MLQTLPSPENSHSWICVAFKGTKNCPRHFLKHVSYLMELKPNPHRLHLGVYTYTDNNDITLQTFEGMILYGYIVTRVKLRRGGKNWKIIIIISPILSLESNSASNAILSRSEHTQISCTHTGQLSTVFRNSMAKQRSSSQHCRVQLLIQQMGDTILGLAWSPKQSRPFIE